MKKIVLTVCMMWLFACAAGAESMTLPSPGCVSPGVAGWLKQDFSGNSVTISASGSVDKLFYIRDLSVLQNILSLIRIDVSACSAEGCDITRVQVKAGDEQLSEVLYTFRNGELLFTVDGKPYSIPQHELNALSGTEQFINCLESVYLLLLNDAFPARIDLEKVSVNIGSGEFFRKMPGLKAGDLSISEVRTEDQKLTRLDLNGSFYCMDEPWSLSGWISTDQGGKVSSDNAELLIQKDAENMLDIVLTSKYMTEKQNRKNQSGTVSGNCRIAVTGKLNGYNVKYSVGQKAKNEWKLEEDDLTEKVTLKTSVNWQDKTPELKYRHLNTGSIVWNDSFSVGRNKSENSYSDLHDNVSIELKMDGENVIIASADIRFGKDGGVLSVPEKGERVTGKEAEAVIASVIEKMSRKLYNALNSTNRKKVNQGL